MIELTLYYKYPYILMIWYFMNNTVFFPFNFLLFSPLNEILILKLRQFHDAKCNFPGFLMKNTLGHIGLNYHRQSYYYFFFDKELHKERPS
jgi:hypothetical protein